MLPHQYQPFVLRMTDGSFGIMLTRIKQPPANNCAHLKPAALNQFKA